MRFFPTFNGRISNASPVSRPYIRGFATLLLAGLQNIHPRTHVRGVLWYGASRQFQWLFIFVLSLTAQSCTLLSETRAPKVMTLSARPDSSDKQTSVIIPARPRKPSPQLVHVHKGGASWYGPRFHGKKTASGAIFDQSKFTAAHKTFPLGSRAKVTHLENGKSIEVEINDRGPYVAGRIIDLSRAAARELGIIEDGIATVQVELISEPQKTHATETRQLN
jgi:rare lipoprotein A